MWYSKRPKVAITCTHICRDFMKSPQQVFQSVRNFSWRYYLDAKYANKKMQLRGLSVYRSCCWLGQTEFNSLESNDGHIDGLVQERRNSGALVTELRLSCTNPLICVRECGHRWFMRLLVALRHGCHFLNQCWFIVKQIPTNKTSGIESQYSLEKVHLKMSAKWQFCSRLNLLKRHLRK